MHIEGNDTKQYVGRTYFKGALQDESGCEITMEKWLGAPPQFSESDIDETIEADVVVAGAALTGLAAARAAIEEGCTVAVFEKSASLPSRAGDFAVIGSKYCEENWGRGCEELRETIVAGFMKDMNYRPSYPLIRRWADESGEAFDWYLQGFDNIYAQPTSTSPVPDGFEAWIRPDRFPLPPGFNLSKEYYPCYPVTVRVGSKGFFGGTDKLFEGNWKLCENTGRLNMRLSTPAVSLIKEKGRVTGLIAKSNEGKVIRAYARKGVVLSTGDYAGNRNMLQYYIPWAKYNKVVYHAKDIDGKWVNYGDGHRMAMWAGAKMEEGPHGLMAHNMGGVLGVAGFLQIDINGRRFMNEDVLGQQVDHQITRLPGRMAWQLFDSAWTVQVPHMSPGHGSVCGVSDTLHSGESYASQKQVDKSVERGSTLRADTLSELIEKMQLTERGKRNAAASIERYNELSRKGRDEDFYKMPSRMFPLEKGPFYAAKITPAAILAAVGGIECDDELHALDEDRNVIPGLYVAGNVQGGRFNGEYPISIPGISYSMCITYGRIAGKNAANEEVGV